MKKRYILTKSVMEMGVFIPTSPLAPPVLQLPKGFIFDAVDWKEGVPSAGVRYDKDIIQGVKVAYRIPRHAVRIYIKNANTIKSQSSSYLGESIISGKEQKFKNMLVIIGMLFMLFIAYLALTGKLFKSLES